MHPPCSFLLLIIVIATVLCTLVLPNDFEAEEHTLQQYLHKTAAAWTQHIPLP